MRRHYGWRKALAYGLGGVIALVKATALSSMTDGVSYEALLVVERFNALAIVCFGAQVLAPATVLLRRLPRTFWIVTVGERLSIAGLLVLALATLAWAIGEGADGLLSFYVGASAVTIASAWAPVWLLEFGEWLRSQPWYRRLFLAGEGANAGFASARELRRRRFEPNGKNGTYAFNDGLLLGHTLLESTYEPFPVRLCDELGTILLGAARSGKSVRFLWLWAATNDQIAIFVDPKGHALRLVTGRLTDPEALRRFGALGVDPEGITRAIERRKDGVVYQWDPYGLGAPYTGRSINVIRLIDPESPYCRVIVSAISQSIVIPSGSETHWSVELTRLVLDGMILHVRTRRPLAEQNLSYLADLFAGLDRSHDDLRQAADFQAIERLITEMADNPAGGGLPMQAAQAFQSLEGREIGIVVSEIARALKSFSDVVIRQATSGEGIDLRGVVESKTPVTLFLSLPFGALVEHQRVLRAIASCLLRLTEHRRDKSRAVHFFFDEFAAYGKSLSAVRDATVTLGGAGARLHIALQYAQQMPQCVGREAADAFEASSNIVAAGVADQATCEYLARRLGRRPRGYEAQKLHAATNAGATTYVVLLHRCCIASALNDCQSSARVSSTKV